MCPILGSLWCSHRPLAIRMLLTLKGLKHSRCHCNVEDHEEHAGGSHKRVHVPSQRLNLTQLLPQLFPAGFRPSISDRTCVNLQHQSDWGKSKRRLTNGGLSPQIFRENREENPSWEVGPFRGKSGLFRGYSGFLGPIAQPQRKSRNGPERALFGPLAPLGQAPVC